MFQPISRVTFLALSAAVLLHTPTASASTLAPNLELGARVAGECSWEAQSLSNDEITVHVGEAVEFQGIEPFYFSYTLDWTFAGQVIPLDTASSPATQGVFRAWDTPGSYLVEAYAGTTPGFPITVHVVPESNVNVKARITADNSYRLGVGNALGITTIQPAVDNTLASEIFSCSTGAEAYTVSAPLHGYLYVVAWSDDGVAQGLLAQFRRKGLVPWLDGSPRYSGDPAWQVFATGIDFDGLPGPSLAEINLQIGVANASAGDPLTSSTSWVGMEDYLCGEYIEGAGFILSGEKNDLVTPDGSCDNFVPYVCGINTPAEWMWYTRLDTSCPFTGGSDQDEFLIFRLPVSELPAPGGIIKRHDDIFVDQHTVMGPMIHP